MMNTRLIGSLAIAIVVAAGMASAQKKPKPQDVRAVTTFRCDAGDPGSVACGPVSDFTDRVRDDSGGSYPDAMGSIRTTGGYQFHFDPSSFRHVSLNLGQPTSIPPCVTAGNCNPDHGLVVDDWGDGDDDDIQLDDFSIELKPLTATGADLPGLLWGMACSDRAPSPVPYPVKVHYTFRLPSPEGHWGFNFNQLVYPGTNNAVVTRDSETHWTVVSDGRIGELLSWGHSGLQRPQSGPSHEGLYYANFEFTIEAAGLPAPGVGVCPN